MHLTVAGKHVATNAHGLSTLTLPLGSYTVSARAAGYAPATISFTVG